MDIQIFPVLDTITVHVFPFVLRAAIVFMTATAILVLLLLTIQLLSMAWERNKKRIQAQLSPFIEACIADPENPALEHLHRLRRPFRHVLQYAIIFRSFGETSERLSRISSLYDSLGFIDADLRRLNNPFWWVRAEGARCLGQMKSDRAKPFLLKKLKDRVTEVRLISAWALGRIGDPDIINPILESLVRTSRLAGMRLASTVFELGTRAVIPLIVALNHADSAVRVLALHLIAEIKDKNTVRKVIEHTRPSETLEVRLAAFKALGTIGQASAADCLVAGLSDAAWQVRAQAARSLGCIAGFGAIPPLVRAMDDPNWWVKRNAGEALSKLGIQGEEALLNVYRERAAEPAGRMAAQWLDELGRLPQAL